MTLGSDARLEVRCFDVRVQPNGDVVRVEPVGELDLAVVSELRAPIDELLAAGFAELIVDLRELSFIDLAGLRLILELAGQAQAEGWTLTLVQGGNQLRRIFALAGVLDSLPLTDQAGVRETR